MAGLRAIALDAPAHPEDMLILRSICLVPGVDNQLFERKERENLYWAARRLREYFFPDRPLPPFEPITFAGTVAEVAEIDGSVVVFGDIQSWLIRKNPIHCITPDGQKVITSAARLEFVQREADEDSPDPTVRRCGKPGMFLGSNVQSIAEVPPQSEVWVDRTNISQIPAPSTI